jgi:hypothetical protein
MIDPPIACRRIGSVFLTRQHGTADLVAPKHDINDEIMTTATWSLWGFPRSQCHFTSASWTLTVPLGLTRPRDVMLLAPLPSVLRRHSVVHA